MRCSSCDHDNPSGSRFCEQCGAAHSRRCPACECEVSEAARFCGACGEALPAEAAPTAPPRAESYDEYRQLTVMFIDIVDSTELTGRLEPEEMRDTVRAYQQICSAAIDDLDGYVAQYLGDGVLAYFGYPRAHEDDAERAVRCALDLQRGLRERFEDGSVRTRIGIHTGDVIVGEMGGEARRDVLALGQATNLAARIDAVADAGGVVISEATHELTSGIFVVRDLGQHELKGIDELTRLYQVERVLGGRRRRPAPIPLFGRDAELALLTERFEEALDGRGQVILVSGEPGIGKTRLCLGLRNAIFRAPYIWLELACTKYSSGSPLRPVIDLFIDRFASFPDLSNEERSELLARGLDENPGVQVEAVVPLLLSLLDLPPLDRFPLPVLAPEQQRECTMNALCSIVEALASQQTIVLAVEDLQWADPSTLEFLRRLVDASPQLRLLLLCTARPEFEAPWRRSHASVVHLHRLSPRPTREMVAALGGNRQLPEDLAQRIVDRSDGIPLYIEELARSVLDALATGSSDQMVGELSVPNSLQSSLVARLDRLGSAKRVAQLASTLGREFDYRLLERIGEVAPAALQRGLRQLVEAEILYEQGSSPTATYRFRHALLQDTAYRLQLPSDRRKTHARVADLLESEFKDRTASEPEVTAHHCYQAGLHERAAIHYQTAGTLSARRYANEEALGYLDSALAELGQLAPTTDRHQRELDVQLARAQPLAALRGFDHPEVEELYLRIELLVRDLGRGAGQFGALLALAQYHQRVGAIKKATVVGETALDIVRDAGAPLLEVVALLTIGSNKITTAPLLLAIADLERALEIARSIDIPPPTNPLQPEIQSFLQAVLSIALGTAGRSYDAEQQAVLARERAFAVGHEPTIIQVLALCSITHNLSEDFETALAWGRESLQLGGGRGFHTAEAEALTNVGWARVALGDPGGLEDVEAGVDAALRSGFKGGRCEYLEAAANAALLAGRFERAHEFLDLARENYEATGEAICFEGRGTRLRGMTYLRQGEHEKARNELERAYRLLDRYGARLEMLMAATELMQLARGGPGEGGARARLEALYESFDPSHDYRPLRRAAALLEQTAPADPRR